MLSETLKTHLICGAAAMTLLSAATISAADAAAVRGGQFNTSQLTRCDDSCSQSANFGFDFNFFGTTYTGGFVNTNGNMTLDSALSTFTPFGIQSSTRPILAPFFADVDTRSTANGAQPVTFGQGSVDGRNAFGVNWVDVGFYNQMTDPLNSFQLVIIDRSDTGAGNVDIEFNYDQILWEAGSASGGDGNGLFEGPEGASAAVGYSNGEGDFFEFDGSRVAGSFLDGGCDLDSETALICNSRLSQVDGRYVFQVRNGTVVEEPIEDDQEQTSSSDVPEPTTMALFGAGLLGFGALRRRSRRS